MTQEEVIEFLEAHPNEWFTAKDIGGERFRNAVTNLSAIYKSTTQRQMYNLERRKKDTHYFTYEWRVKTE